MRPRIAFAATLGLAALFALRARAIDFTPRPETQVIDTYPIHYFSFADEDGRRVEYGPPSGWKCTGSPTRLSLENPAQTQAQASFNLLPVEKPGPHTAAQLERFKAVATSRIPPDGADPVITQEVGQHPIGNREAYAAHISYNYFGLPWRLRVTFINLGKSTLQITCSAPGDAFETFTAALDSSLYSWHWVDPK